MMMYFSGLATCGIILNIWLYFDDLNYRGGILNAIDKSKHREKPQIAMDTTSEVTDFAINSTEDYNPELDTNIKVHESIN